MDSTAGQFPRGLLDSSRIFPLPVWYPGFRHGCFLFALVACQCTGFFFFFFFFFFCKALNFPCYCGSFTYSVWILIITCLLTYQVVAFVCVVLAHSLFFLCLFISCSGLLACFWMSICPCFLRELVSSLPHPHPRASQNILVASLSLILFFI